MNVVELIYCETYQYELKRAEYLMSKYDISRLKETFLQPRADWGPPRTISALWRLRADIRQFDYARRPIGYYGPMACRPMKIYDVKPGYPDHTFTRKTRVSEKSPDFQFANLHDPVCRISSRSVYATWQTGILENPAYVGNAAYITRATNNWNVAVGTALRIWRSWRSTATHSATVRWTRMSASPN